MTKYDLYAYSRHSDPVTSHAAAESVETHVAHLEAAVLGAIPTQGATWDELNRITGIDKASLSPRFKPLRKKGLIEVRETVDGRAVSVPCSRPLKDVNNPVKRAGRSGKGQIVWFRKRA